MTKPGSKKNNVLQNSDGKSLNSSMLSGMINNQKNFSLGAKVTVPVFGVFGNNQNQNTNTPDNSTQSTF